MTIPYGKVLNLLFWLILVMQDAGTFGVLPLNLFQILELVMLVILCMQNPKLKIPRTFFILIGYITLITFVNKFDFESIKTLLFLILSLLTFVLYLQRTSKKEIFSIIYDAAFFLAFYGCIQEFAYIAHVPALYDISRYGFTVNGAYASSNGLMRAMSLYAEPAHTSSIVGLSFLIGIVGEKEKIGYIKRWKTIIIMAYAVLTQSALVYLALIGAVISFVVFFQDGLQKKVKWIVTGLLAVAGVLLVQGELVLQVLGKLSQFKTLETDTGNDLSALAVVSNFKIAVEKMKDGYWWGTGIDSHRLYYDRYIHRIYDYLYMYLNSSDCASLYTRIFSEFGIVGFILFICALIRKLLQSIKLRNKILSICVIMFCITVARNGNYMHTLTEVMFCYMFLYAHGGTQMECY